MASKPGQKRSIWTWGLESEEPSNAQRRRHAEQLSKRFGVEITAQPIPRVESLQLRPPRVKVPPTISSFCYTDNYERALHSYSADDKGPAVFGIFPNPPDIVAHPRTETELENVLSWCDSGGYVTIPFGGGSSVVGGVTPPPGQDIVVTIDMDRFDRVLEIDETSRAARIQTGVFGPALEDQLRPHGYTLRHFPQSFTGSTLGGWIATRSSGHYATNHTHIDEFVESVRMLTPTGWYESKRLPGSGAGPDPNRIVIGSEGILGIITEAWMRIQARPRFRATAGVTFDSWEEGYEATRHIAQAKLWPANLRILDPQLAGDSAGLNGSQALLIIGFESSEANQEWNLEAAVQLARESGGHIDDHDILIEDGTGKPTGRAGPVGAWRNAFIAIGDGLTAGLGIVSGTFETAVTWDKWPAFDAHVRGEVKKALREVCGGGTLNCRFTHVYTDGPAPYYTYAGVYRPGGYEKQQTAIKNAASDAIIKAGGTITHHHAVGKLHRPWYDQERPDLFAKTLTAAKNVLDPNGILNPGVLIDA